MTLRTLTRTFQVDPIGKPRMTQRDKWNPSLAVKRYHRFKDQMLEAIFGDPELREFLKTTDVLQIDWSAFIGIPKTWTAAKRESLAGALHRQKPDKDNIEKALLDAVLYEDSGIACGWTSKQWDDGKGPRLVVTFKGPRKEAGQ